MIKRKEGGLGHRD